MRVKIIPQSFVFYMKKGNFCIIQVESVIIKWNGAIVLTVAYAKPR